RPCLRAGVVFVHGGGWSSGDKSTYSREGEAVARSGWVGFASNHRLEGPAHFPPAVEDVFAALRWIRDHAARFGLDPNRLAVFGGSAGGNLAALVTADPTRYGHEPLVRAGVSWSGMYDLRQLALSDPNGLGAMTRNYLGCSLHACAARYR